MDLTSTYLPDIVTTNPVDGETNVATDIELSIRFTMDIAFPYLADKESQLNTLISVYPKGLPPVALGFVSYDTGTYTLTFKPSADLVSVFDYVVVVSEDLRSSSGRGMPGSYSWGFTTSASPVSTVSLLSPTNGTYYSSIPIFSWSAVASAASYVLEISSVTDFATTTYTAAVTSTSISNISSTYFADGCTYYWRVRALSAVSSGAWSDTWAFRVDARPAPAPEYAVRPVFNQFGSSSIFPAAGVSYLAGASVTPYVTYNISLATGDVSVAYSTYDISVLGAGQLTTETVVATANAYTLTFPTVAVAANTRYEFVVPAGIVASDGSVSTSALTVSFCGGMSPMYSDVETLRMLYGRFLTRYTDYEIQTQLHRASVKANRAASGTTSLALSDLMTVEDPLTYETKTYVETTAAYALIQNYLFELLEEAGRTTTLDVYTSTLNAAIVKDIQDLLKHLKEQTHDLEVDLGGGVTPVVGIRSSSWDPSALYDDQSIQYLIRGKF